MNANKFLRLVAKKADVTITDTELIFSALLEAINECVQNKEPFTIRNFGTMDFSKRKAWKVHSKMFGDREFPEVPIMFFRISTNLKRNFKK
jgi:nucleoid DNA-binding protein